MNYYNCSGVIHHRSAAVVALALLSCVSLKAQSVVATSPSAQSTSGYNSHTSTPSGPPQSNIASAFSKQRPLAQWGPVEIRPHFAYRVLYGDGILRVPGEPANTTIQTITLGTLFEIGKHWNLDYGLARSFSSSRLLADTTDQNANLKGTYSFDEWTAHFRFSYGTNSPTLVETGQQTHERTLGSGFGVSRELGERTQLEFTFDRNARYANPLTATSTWTGSDWVQWTGSAWLNYHASTKFTFAIGSQLGYDEIVAAPDMKSYRSQARVTWQPTEKLALSAEGGIEYRKFTSRIAGQLRTPTYSFSGTYRPFQTTSLTVSGSRQASASYYSDLITKGSQWTIGLNQRLLARYFISVSASHGKTNYLIPEQGFVVSRNDEYDSIHLALSTVFLKRASGSIFFEQSHNSSNAAGLAFTSHQIGGELSYRF